jgi:hypothetical protein
MAMSSRGVDGDPVGSQTSLVVDLAFDSHEGVDIHDRPACSGSDDFDRGSCATEIGVGLGWRRKSLDRRTARARVECGGVVELGRFERPCLRIPAPTDSQSLTIAAHPCGRSDLCEARTSIADVSGALSYISHERRHGGLFTRRLSIETRGRDHAIGAA